MSEKSRAFALHCIRSAKRWQLAAVQGLQLASLPLNQRIELASQSPTSPLVMGRSEAARRAFVEANKPTWSAHFRASPDIAAQFLGDESLYLAFLEGEILEMSVDDVLLNFSAASGQDATATQLAAPAPATTADPAEEATALDALHKVADNLAPAKPAAPAPAKPAAMVRKP